MYNDDYHLLLQYKVGYIIHSGIIEDKIITVLVRANNNIDKPLKLRKVKFSIKILLGRK